MTVTNAMPADETACQILNHNLERQMHCIKPTSDGLADNSIAARRIALRRTESSDSPRLRIDALR